MRRCHKLEDSQEDIQSWIEPFEPFTFPTSLLPFTKDTARAYISVYRSRYCSGPLPTDEEKNLLNQLSQDIDHAISQLSPPCFIRLTSRSPKDAVQFDFDDFLTRSTHFTINKKLKLYFQLMTENLQVSTGSEALKLMRESERVYVDILQSIDADSEPITSTIYCPWNVGICVRKWDNRINDQWEFRCFIYNYQLVAISQYNTYIYCSELLEHKEKIYHLILSFYKYYIFNIFNSIQKPNCILDVAVFPPPPSISDLPDLVRSLDSILQYIIIIELNPYNSRTGAGCFRWDADQNILFNDQQSNQQGAVFRLVGEEDTFDMVQFSKYQENLYEGLTAELHREDLKNHEHDKSCLHKSSSSREESRCVVM